MSTKSLEELGSYHWDDDDDEEDETLQRHAYHPSASSRNSAGLSVGSGGSSRSISSVSLTPVRSPESDQGSSGRISAPKNDRNVPEIGGLENIEDSRLSLDEIIKLKKLKKTGLTGNQDGYKWKRSRGQRQAHRHHQEYPKDRKNLKRSRTQILLEEESMGFVGNPMKKNRRNLRPAELAEVKYTPESGLRFLLELGFVITIRVFENADEEAEDFHARRWRAVVVDVRDDSVQGIGEGRRKQLAKDSASMDFLQNVKRKRPELAIPYCEVLKGVRISPLIAKEFMHMCKRQELGEPTCLENLVMVGGMEKYMFTVIVGRAKFSSTSFLLKYAQFKALKKAFDALNVDGLVYELDPIIMGDDCSDGSCCNLIETEQLNIVNSSRAPGNLAWKCDEKYLYTPMGALEETTTDPRYAPGDPLNGEFPVSPGAGYSKSATLQGIRQFIRGQLSNNNPEQGGYNNNPTSGPSSDIPTYGSRPAPRAPMSPPVFVTRSGPSFMKIEQSELMSPMPQSGLSRSSTPAAFETRLQLQRLNIQTPEGSSGGPLRPSSASSALSDVPTSLCFGTNLVSQATIKLPNTSATMRLPNTSATMRLPNTSATMRLPNTSATMRLPNTSATMRLPNTSATMRLPNTSATMRLPSTSATSQGFQESSMASLPSTGPLAFAAKPQPVPTSSKHVAVPKLNIPSGSVSMMGFGAGAPSQDPMSLNNIRRFWHKGVRDKAVATVNQYEHFPVDPQDKFGGEAPYGMYFGSLPEEEDADEHGRVTTRMTFTAHSGSASFNLASYRSRIGLADSIDQVENILGDVMKGQLCSKGSSVGKSNPFR